MLLVAGPGEAGERGPLQLGEAGVGDVRVLVVVAGEDDRVAGEVGGVAVVVEVEEVGEKERRATLVDDPAGQLPGAVRIVFRRQPQRRAGQLQEALLEAAGAAVGEPRRRELRGREVIEAGAGAEPEGELLGNCLLYTSDAADD